MRPTESAWIADDEARAALVGALDAGADDEAAANVPALLKRRIEAALEPLVVVPFRYTCAANNVHSRAYALMKSHMDATKQTNKNIILC